MIKIAGNNGGTLNLREKGDPSPNKGKKRDSTASLLAKFKKKKMPQMSKKNFLALLCFYAEFTPNEITALVKDGELPVALLVTLRGWIEKRDGFDNLRKSMEMIFGKPQEHTDVTSGGNPIDTALSAMSNRQLGNIINRLANDDGDTTTDI